MTTTSTPDQPHHRRRQRHTAARRAPRRRRPPAADPRRRRGRRHARRAGREPRRNRLRGRHLRPARHRHVRPRGLARRRCRPARRRRRGPHRRPRLDHPTVVGVSSGGVVALDLAARHPDLVGPVVAWEPPRPGTSPAAPRRPRRSWHRSTPTSPCIPTTSSAPKPSCCRPYSASPSPSTTPPSPTARANAEPFVRDEPAITTTALDEHALATADVTIAIGSAPNQLIATAVDVLTRTTGHAAVHVEADHEVYLDRPGRPHKHRHRHPMRTQNRLQAADACAPSGCLRSRRGCRASVASCASPWSGPASAD